MIEKTVTLSNDNGLHARPAGILVKTVTKFKSNIEFKIKDKKISGKSVLALMGQSLKKGDSLTILANGEDESEAVMTIEKLILNNFLEN